MAGYYYGQLSKEKKAVYDMLAAGCDALAAVIRVPDLGTEVLSDIYLRMKLDLPLLFFVTGFHYRKMPGADHVEVLPDYLFDRGKVKMHRQAVTARLERLARPLKGKSDREKELAIHDFILENVTYDKLKKSYSTKSSAADPRGGGVRGHRQDGEGPVRRCGASLYRGTQRGGAGDRRAIPAHMERGDGGGAAVSCGRHL